MMAEGSAFPLYLLTHLKVYEVTQYAQPPVRFYYLITYWGKKMKSPTVIYIGKTELFEFFNFWCEICL